MSTQKNILQEYKGLSEEEVLSQRKANGLNEIKEINNYKFLNSIISVVKEPMFVLLLVTAILYFIRGEVGDALFMISAIVVIIGISLYQESRSRHALASLKSLTQATCQVIRNYQTIEIKREDLVVGDLILVQEGKSIPADATIIQSNDFAVNESILTGESLSVTKQKNDIVYQGTSVVSGSAICIIKTIGSKTKLGEISSSILDIDSEESPLQKQINRFVKKMAIIGGVTFLIVWILNYLKSGSLVSSLLKALTLAMSILPEEIPVAFTTFMALGAWRLMKAGIIVKETKTVETLGSATVICIDKTGTITENTMSLKEVYVLQDNTIYSIENFNSKNSREIIRYAMWASEPTPFDPMEIALHNAYVKFSETDERSAHKLVHEFPLSGKPPMMTHVFERDDNQKRIIAAKGAPEALLAVSDLNEVEKSKINSALNQLTSNGYRVLAVGYSNFSLHTFPKNQQELKFTFVGLIAFTDPPKKNIKNVLESFYNAGIKVKIITGDNTNTTKSIAKMIGFKNHETALEGEQLAALTDEMLLKKVEEVNIFTRMFPEAKLRILKALQTNGHIVAMTGDGVNDGPALKAAHIGIAMGKKGSELAKEASSIILVNDDLEKMVEAIATGRKIYTNLKKAIQYIISIHIPIILVVLLPLALGWLYPTIFSPIHIIFLELIMGPTCSVVYENEPLEKNSMFQNPRNSKSDFFNWRELSTSITQGLIITFGALSIYQYGVYQHLDESSVRTMVFSTLLFSNIFLTLVNRSFYYSILTTINYKNRLVPAVLGISLLSLFIILYIPAATIFFEFKQLDLLQFVLCISTGFISTCWYEIIKFSKRTSLRT